MDDATYYLISIFLKSGKEDELRRYEKQAEPIMRKYGGEFVMVLRPTDTEQTHAPDEIHILRFETADGFVSFRDDPLVIQLRSVRDDAVEKVSVLELKNWPLESYFDSI
ncbi:DUF1330 domain-containing protein [Kaarinaea lacus]